MTTMTAEREYQHIGASRGCEDHDYDLVHELTKRLEGVWRYDQYLANAEKHPALQSLWRELKEQHQRNVKKLKELLTKDKRGCF